MQWPGESGRQLPLAGPQEHEESEGWSMDEELDLRAVSLAIVRRWKLILIMCALALVAGALVMLLSPPEYHSTATVAVAKPRFILR